MKTIMMITAVAVFFGCAQGKEGSQDAQLSAIAKDSSALTVVPQNISGCYQMVIGKDSALLNLTTSSNIATGDLVYNRYQKDDNIGTLTLQKEGERLDGFYTFQSEGKLSVRQVIFKITAAGLVEGFGDVTMSGDTAVFKYPHAISYEEKYAFTKVDCK